MTDRSSPAATPTSVRIDLRQSAKETRMFKDPLRLLPPGRLLRWPEVRAMVGISRTTAWRLQNIGAFPLPVVISAGRVGWREEDIAAWNASLSSTSLRRRKMAQGDGEGDGEPCVQQLGFDV